jgi:hypothetical protein
VRALTGKRSQQGAGSSPATRLVLLAVVFALAGCSGNSNATDATATSTTRQAATTTPTSTATTATTEESEAAVLAAYRAFWADVVAAAKTADWRSSRLNDHATGKMLDRIRRAHSSGPRNSLGESRGFLDSTRRVRGCLSI